MDKLLTPARVVISSCMEVKPGEEVLVVFDRPKKAIAEALVAAALEAGAAATALEIEPTPRDGAEPPRVAAKAMAAADVLLCPTSRSLTHTQARRDACAAGARAATLPGITEETMIRTLSADYDAIAARSKTVAGKMAGARRVHITAAAGTDVVIDMKGRVVHGDTGKITAPGGSGNLPAGEVALAPREGYSYGRVVVDGSMAGFGRLSEPIEFEVENGLAVRFGSTPAAKELREALSAVGPDAFTVAELGIGTNHAAVVTGSVLEDEKVLGTIHIALGNNMFGGGSVDVPIHLDGVILGPTLVVDDEILILDRGRLVL